MYKEAYRCVCLDLLEAWWHRISITGGIPFNTLTIVCGTKWFSSRVSVHNIVEGNVSHREGSVSH